MFALDFVVIPSQYSISLAHISVRHTTKLHPKRPCRLFSSSILCTWKIGLIKKELAMLHVMLDLYGCNPELLADEIFLWQGVGEVTRLPWVGEGSPVVLRYIVTSSPRDAGDSG